MHNLDGVFNVTRDYFYNRYRSPVNPGNGKTPTAAAATVLYRTVNSDWVEDADYLRIQNLTLGYNFKGGLLKNTNAIRNARLYISAQNLATFTNYSGANPATGRKDATGASLTPGEDATNYPLARVYTIGFNLTF